MQYSNLWGVEILSSFGTTPLNLLECTSGIFGLGIELPHFISLVHLRNKNGYQALWLVENIVPSGGPRSDVIVEGNPPSDNSNSDFKWAF